MAPPMSYIPVIGNDNLVSVRESDDTPVSPGTINGAAVSGRQGVMKTSLLVSMQNAINNATPEAILRVQVACPPGFSTPNPDSLVGFDYTELLPVVSAQAVCKDFTTGDVPELAWPASLLDFYATSGLVDTLVQLTARLINATPPTPTYPYGTLTYEFAASSAPGSFGSGLIAVTIDFGASSAN